MNIQSVTKSLIHSFAVATLLGSFSGCQTIGPNTATGGALGGLTGGLIGASIGAQDGKTTEGALIGAVTGAAAGGTVGQALDWQATQDSIQFARSQEMARQSAVSINQVVQMTQSGLSNEVIVQQIQSSGVTARPTSNDLIALKNSGVADVVINSLQTAPFAGQHAYPPSPQPVNYPGAPVIIQAIPYHYPPPRYFQRPHCRPTHGAHYGFAIGF